MRHVWTRPARGVFSIVLLTLATIIRAVTLDGVAAPLSLRERTRPGSRMRGDLPPAARSSSTLQEKRAPRRATVPRVVRFREAEDRGLLVKGWVNGAGPYTFAIDTGAGATILSRRLAAEARVSFDGGSALSIGGLSGTRAASGRKASVRSLSLGERDNATPAGGLFIVADGLPPDIDAILDPTESLWPLGYVVDFPNGELAFFDPRENPLRRNAEPSNGTIVPWLFDDTSRRPFVMLTGGRRALLDTGSGFGLAVTQTSARAIGIRLEDLRERDGVRDIAGGRVSARRLRPATVHIGSLALRGVPTDLLLGANADAPILLGRDALRPFKITFDPANKLIRIEAG